MAKTRFDEEKLAKLWQQYKANPSPSLKAVIAEEYASVVRNVVATVFHKKPPLLDYEDLLQAGRMGLLDAIDKYNPDREPPVLFQTYASIRVRGAILDEINTLDWTPRSIRENIRGVLRSIDKHYEETQSEPTLSEIAERSELDIEATRLVMQQMNKTYMVQAEHETLDLLSPGSDHAQADIRASVRYVIDTMLNDEEKQFVQLKFFQGYSNSEIISMMHLTPLSFKTLKDAAINKLTDGLEGYDQLL